MSEDHLEESYGTDLATVIMRANRSAPIFSQNLEERSHRAHRLPRIISPDSDGKEFLVSDYLGPSKRLVVQSSATVPLVPRAPAAATDDDVDMSNRPRSNARFSQRPADTPSGRLGQTGISASTQPPPGPSSGSPRKRKRSERKSRPPGVRNLEEHMKAMAEQEQREARKRRRVDFKDSEKDTDMLVDKSVPEPPAPAASASSSDRPTTGVPTCGKSSSGPSKPPLTRVAPVPLPVNKDVPSRPKVLPTPRPPPKDSPAPPVPEAGPSEQPAPARPLPNLNPLSVSDTPQGREQELAIANTVKILAEQLLAQAIAPRPQADAALASAVAVLQDEVKELRAAMQALREARKGDKAEIEAMKRENARLDADLQKQREERHHVSKAIRDMEVKFLEQERSTMEKTQARCEELIKTLMLNARENIHAMCRKALEDNLKQPFVLSEQRTIVINPNTDPGSSVPHPPRAGEGRPVSLSFGD
ncbi:hypothetical protein C8Q76DRAFT_102199 [Earliella scabrosa]|nr:hypothetical protein C8Q76DRAFT_102199 [Earliella scabrosa]